MDNYFINLTDQLVRRSTRAVLSQLGMRSPALREYLRQQFEQMAGENGSFVADPVFEATFGWQAADKTMAQLMENLLHEDLVLAMDSPPEDLAEQRFNMSWYPHQHQLQAWQTLNGEEIRSAVITSGTGSGKTECFLVPILNDLAWERARQPSRLRGVRALFLYPLNALINSQRERLKAWTAAFNGDIRYCLYNGETPAQVKTAEQRATPQEVLSRDLLRSEPPPVLVTNATMLEYMLVRNEDNPILAQSQGQLRWIVLDEAHTYIGSQAAELALLLRRVAHAFGVEPSQLRFVATSATIGGGTDNVAQKLQYFLADVAGIAPENVSVIEGRRSIPELPEKLRRSNLALPQSVAELASLDDSKLFERLAGNLKIRDMRAALTQQPERLSRLAEIVFGGSKPEQRRDTLALLDLSTRAKFTDKKEDYPLIPLRGHVFHRTQSGLWACCNQDCTGRKNTLLEDGSWPFGRVFMERQEHCPHCNSLVFELVLCSECGTEYLAAEEHFDEKARQYSLKPRRFDRDQDEFQLEFEELDVEGEESDREEDTAPRSKGSPRLISRASKETETLQIHPQSGDISDQGVSLHILRPEVGHQHCRCPECGKTEKHPQELFRPARIGAPFLLSVAIPTLLESSPPGQGEVAQGPWQGRRLITFSDSRQGTARFALKAQLDAERNHIRSTVYHQLAAARPHVDPQMLAALQEEILALEQVVKSAPVLQNVLEGKRAELARHGNLTPVGRLSWADAANALRNDEDLRNWIPQYWEEAANNQIRSEAIPDFLLYQEFWRRPRRMNSLETLGLAALHYPKIEQINSIPAVWQQRNLSLADWRNFLKIMLDFFVRAADAVDMPREYARWMGRHMRRTFLIGPGADIDRNISQRRWPQFYGQGSRPRIISLLAMALRLNIDTQRDKNDLNQIFADAWTAIRPMLTQYADGYLLPLHTQAELSEVTNAWLCPITHRGLDTTFRGSTPYVTPKTDNPDQFKCQPITMPRLPHAFWKETTDKKISDKEIQAWLETDTAILNARTHAVWPELSDRIASGVPYFRVAEHSAQQSGKKLRDYEDRFKKGRVNVLSCSTTMEMGVDIGGLSVVAMNNAPPSPANYLQRAGRAGRRQEATAAGLTLCKSTPHNEAVFRNPLWPFRTPIHVPQVSLQSTRIVKRHLNALLLADFLSTFGQNIPKLTAGWFYDPPADGAVSPAQQFAEWCRDSVVREQDGRLPHGVHMLLQRTCLAGMPFPRILENSAQHSEELRERWERERDQLLRDQQEFARRRPQDPATPAELAIERQLQRLRGEYLLRELAAKGFLPGYGFPNDVVPFITSTLEELREKQLRREQSQTKSREDNTQTYRDYPSRELMLALREYAPGAEIVVDGKVYKSEGVTLNWHVPASEQQVNETQALRWAWRCKSCGATGDSARMVGECQACQSSNIQRHDYLQPAGFAVSIGYKPDNDLSKNTYVPVQTPWLTVATEWLSFPVPSVGRYRYSAEGHIFHWNAGLHNHGFAVCLRCGKAASETEERPTSEGAPLPALPASLHEHFRLRGGREADGASRCSGNDDTWAIKRHLWLGTAAHTDVFELQILDSGDNHQPLNDKTTAYSLAVALRQALAEKLGVNEREIGCDAVHTTTDNDSPVWSIVLYDTASGGAGYVASAAGELEKLFVSAKEMLTCSCDKACHQCLLSFDTQHQIDYLDRSEALNLLTPRFFSGLQLPDEKCIFGDTTRAELDPIRTAISRELQSVNVQEIRLYFGGEYEKWALPEWSLRNDILRWLSKNYTVTLVVEDAPQDVDLSNTLASFAEFGCQVVQEQGVVGTGRLLAATGGTHGYTQWAVFGGASRIPGTLWGRSAEGQHCVRHTDNTHPLPKLSGKAIAANNLRRSYGGNVHELKITHELDGAITDFGTRFWQAVLDVRSDMKTKLSTQSALKEIQYTDRYLKSPLVIKLLGQIVLALATVDQIVASDTRLIIRTAEIEPKRMTPEKIEHDWQQDNQRNKVAEAYLQQGFPGQVDVDSRHVRQLPHARELRLLWQSGDEWILRFDQGMGYWVPARTVDFDFSKPVSSQAKQLTAAVFEVRARDKQHPGIVYLMRG